MDTLFKRLEESTGAPIDQIKLIFCLLISYPLGSLFVRLPQSRPELKHLFSIATSAFFLLRVFDLWLGTLQLLCSVCGTYILINTLQGRIMPWVVFAFVMGHLTLNHTYRALHEIAFETFEITGCQMVLTMKLTTFAWNVWDGRRPVEELDKWQHKHRVVIMPSLLEVLGYAFYFPGLLVGPYTEYTTYASLIDGSSFSAHETASGRRVPHGRKRVAYTRLLMGLGFLIFFVIFGEKYTYESILKDSWWRKGFLHRMVLVQFFGIVARSKYYSVWTLTEGASILTGLGFTEFTPSGTIRWDGATNVNPVLVEWPPNIKIMIDSWNMKTNVWLRECVYKRVARKGKKPGFKSSMTTFIVSAFWHGIAAGYFLMFLLGGIQSAVGRLCRSYIRPLLLPPVVSSSTSNSTPNTQAQAGSSALEPKPEPPRTLKKMMYDFLSSALTVASINFGAAAFVIGGFKDSLEAWRRLYWYGIWVVFPPLLLFLLGGKNWLKRIAQQRMKRAEKRREEETKGVKVISSRGTDIQNPGPYVLPPVDLAVSQGENL